MIYRLNLLIIKSALCFARIILLLTGCLRVKYNCSEIFDVRIVQEREQFALVFPPSQVKSTWTSDEVASEHLSADSYEVGLVVTTCSRPSASEADQQQLHLRFWVIVTNQRELFPRLTLDSKHRLISRVAAQTRPAADGRLRVDGVTVVASCSLMTCDLGQV